MTYSANGRSTYSCIRKGFKAVLEEQEGDVPNIHNLTTLHGRIEGHLPEDAEIDVDVLDRLNQRYIDARYPGERGLLPEGKPTEQEAQRLYAFAQHIFEVVRQRLQNSGETQRRVGIGGQTGRSLYEGLVVC